MMVRAKFRVTEINEQCWSNGGKTLTLEAQYDDAIPEDQRFQEATPSGKIEMYVENSKALEQLQLGAYFYVDFTRVSDDTA